MVLLLYVWSACTIYLIGHYLFFHGRLAFFRSKKRSFSNPVSVVICARNEAENLQQNLPAVLDQDYRDFEVIVVNDRSTDSTTKVLLAFAERHSHLKVIDHFPDDARMGKKQALLAGLKAAKHPHFLLTDADCKPASENWLKEMVSHFREKEIVLGFGAYTGTNSFAGKLTQWDTLLSAQQYFSFALAGMPYMGVGRNLAYSRKILETSDAFESHRHLASGDDDLFIGQTANRRNTGICIEPQSFTYSAAPQNFRSWWRQKRRHLTTSYSYKFWPRTFLGLFGLAQLLFYLLLLPVWIVFGSEQLFIYLLILKLAMQLVVLVPAAIKLKQGSVLWLFPVWEALVVVFLGIIHIQNQLKPRTERW